MCFDRVPYRTFKICFAVSLLFTVIPVYCLVLFSISLGFILCCLHLMFQFWFGHVIQDSWIEQCGSKSLICREYCVTVKTVYSHGIFWICKWLLFVLCVTVPVVTMNMNNFRNTQLTGIWTANCFDSSSPYSKMLYKVWHPPHFPFLILSSSLYENFSLLGIYVMS